MPADRAKDRGRPQNLADLRAESARLDEQLGNALRRSGDWRQNCVDFQAGWKPASNAAVASSTMLPPEPEHCPAAVVPSAGQTGHPRPSGPVRLRRRAKGGGGRESRHQSPGWPAGRTRGKSGGRSSPLGGSSDDGNPPLANGPIRDKRLFLHPETGTAIKVGGQTRPDGKLLVSIAVDKAEDKGVVHYATLGYLQPQADGSCHLRVAEPSEWALRNLGRLVGQDSHTALRKRHGGPWRNAPTPAGAKNGAAVPSC